MKAFKKDNSLFLAPETNLTANVIEDIRNYFSNQIKENADCSSIVLDADMIEIVDSLGVNLIIGLFKESEANSKSFIVINAGEKFLKIAHFFRFPSIFKLEGRK